MSAPIAPIGPDEVDAFWHAAAEPFGEAPDPEQLAFQRALTEVERTFAVRDAGRLVALGAAQSLDLSVPGGAAVGLAGVSLLAVLPTHRRRGLGRAMMRRLHEQARERGEPLAGLWASEGGIYHHYGYGVATRSAVVRLDHRVAWRPPGGEAPPLGLVDLDRAVELARTQIAAARTHLAGVPPLSDTRLRRHLFHDPPAWREGAGPRRFVAADGDRGLISYRPHIEWPPDGPTGSVTVDWLMAADPAAEAALWRYLTDMDLVTSVVAVGRPPDDPVALLAEDARQVGMTITDGLWLRVLDPAAVLSARRYAADGRVVVEVIDDDGFAGGRYGLSVEGGAGVCGVAAERATADVTLPVSSLGAAVLGDQRLTRLARAGLADEHRPGALWQLDRMLATERAPWCPFDIE